MSFLAEVCRLKIYGTDVRKLFQNKVKRFCLKLCMQSFSHVVSATVNLLKNISQVLPPCFCQRI